MIEIVWTIKPSRFWLNIIPGSSLLPSPVLVSTERIGPVVPQIVAISTVPSIPSKLPVPPIIVEGNGGGSLISPLNGSEMIVKSLPGPNFLRRGASVGACCAGTGTGIGTGAGFGAGAGFRVGLRVGCLGLDLEICSPRSKTNDVPE